jgi:hypothetical protein
VRCQRDRRRNASPDLQPVTAATGSSGRRISGSPSASAFGRFHDIRRRAPLATRLSRIRAADDRTGGTVSEMSPRPVENRADSGGRQ